MVTRDNDKGKSTLFVAQRQSERLLERHWLKNAQLGIDSSLSDKRMAAIKREEISDKARDIGARLRQRAANIV
ncbi:hypothetical protein DXC79_02745 [Collinsella sp. TF08-11AT]|nr:hypothetical protein DXC79_02745 [Collinsella sp. TF08-11AT]